MSSSHQLIVRFCVLAAALAAVSVIRADADQTARSRRKYAPKPNDFAVVCTLFNGPTKVGKVTLPDIPITYDAHFIVGAQVERVVFGKSPWPAGTLLNFVIHSPTMLFGGPLSGGQFVLTFSPFRPTTPDDKIWFAPETRYLLRAIEKVPAKQPEVSGRGHE